MKYYRVVDTGIIWAEEELRTNYQQFKDECNPEYGSFEEYLDDSVRKCVLKEMNIRDFVKELYDNCREWPDPIDLCTAKIDIWNFRREIGIPEDWTAEEYMEIWNELCGGK